MKNVEVLSVRVGIRLAPARPQFGSAIKYGVLGLSSCSRVTKLLAPSLVILLRPGKTLVGS